MNEDLGEQNIQFWFFDFKNSIFPLKATLRNIYQSNFPSSLLFSYFSATLRLSG